MDIPAKNYIFASLFLLANRLQTLGDMVTEEITLKQWLLLIMILNIGKEHPSVTEIARFMGSTRQNTRKMLDVLSAKGYVALRTNPQDKRNLVVSLTPQTFAFFSRFETKGDDFLEQLFYGIDADLLEGTMRTFIMIFDNLERMEEQYGKNSGNL